MKRIKFLQSFALLFHLKAFQLNPFTSVCFKKRCVWDGYKNKKLEGTMGKLIHEELTFRIRKSLFGVYNQLGPGYREETYKQAVIVDFTRESIPLRNCIRISKRSY